MRQVLEVLAGLMFVLAGVSGRSDGGAAEYPLPVKAALTRLARVAQVPTEEIQVVSWEQVEWPDASLGAPRPGRMYAQVLTPGYKVILQARGRRYEYHTDMGRRVVLAQAEDIGEQEAVPPEKGTEAAVPEALVARCREDLAKRLQAPIEDIRLGQAEAVIFPDGSLGFPRPKEVYTKALVRGWQLTLLHGEAPYLYAAAGTAIRYGGPAAAREISALYIEPLPDEPNLNGNLMQIALAGDNPRLILRGVSDYRPQPDGSLLAMRRTSRSSHELLYLAPGKRDEPVKLAGGFAFADAAVSAEGKQWAALTRSWIGDPWKLIRGPLPEAAQGEPVALPEGLPLRVYWHTENPIVCVRQGTEKRYYELQAGVFRAVSFQPPATEEAVLSRSHSLAVTPKRVENTYVTEIAFLWWDGGRRPCAEIPHFAAEEWARGPGQFLVLSGREDEDHLYYKGFTVDLRTGEVLPTVAESGGPVRLWLVPSPAPIVMKSSLSH